MIIPGKDSIDGMRRSITIVEIELMDSNPNEMPDPAKCGMNVMKLEKYLADFKMTLETELGVCFDE